MRKSFLWGICMAVVFSMTVFTQGCSKAPAGEGEVSNTVISGTTEDTTEDTAEDTATGDNGADAAVDDSTAEGEKDTSTEDKSKLSDLGADNEREKVPGTEDEPAENDEAGKESGTEEDAKTSTEETTIAAPSTCGALHVEGTKLTDSDGNIVQLRGISTHGLAWFPGYVNEECFKQLRQEWNANVIRLAMYTAENGGYCTDGDKAALKKLVMDGVEYATAQDMYVIIDWHILSDNNPNTHIEEAKAFFKEMSEAYADYDNVLYEICNEPNGGTNWSDIKSYAEQVIEVIRKNDEDAVILVGTPNWSQQVDKAAEDPITGYDNIMYTLHFYAATHTDWLRNTMSAAIDAGLPVFVSEFGICDASGNGAIDEKQAGQWLNMMNKYNVSYVAWNLSNKNETSAIFNSSCNKTSGFTENDLSASGKWVYQTLTVGNGVMTGSGGTTSADSGSGDKANASQGGQQAGQNNGNQSGASADEQTTAGSSITLTNGDITYTALLKNSWESEGKVFYQYDLTLKNTSGEDCTSWVVDVKFNDTITFTDGWSGDYTVDGKVLHIASKDYNGQIAVGESVKEIGFIISGSRDLEIEE